MDIDMEQFKPIPGYSRYRISEDGRVFSFFRKRLLSPMPFGKYKRLHVKNDISGELKNEFLHRLIALTYLPNPLNLPFVNHIDPSGEELNNHVSNLEWCNQRENVNHAMKHNLRKTFTKPVTQIDMEMNVIAHYESIIEASRQTNIPADCIAVVCKRTRVKTSGGYYWKYTSDEDWKPFEKKIKFKKIEKCDENWNVMEIYPNMNILVKTQKTSWKSIVKAIKNKSSFRGSYWRYQDDSTVNYEKTSGDILFKKVIDEKWKVVEGFPKYRVSKNGEVFNEFFKKLLNPQLCPASNEKKISLKNNSKVKVFLLKKLVALCYIPNPENKKWVRHIDGNKNNNTVDNLEWTSYQDKKTNSFRTKEEEKEEEDKKEKSIIMYDKLGNIVFIYKSIEELKEKTDFNIEKILNICNHKGKFKLEGGYVWRYEGDSFEMVTNQKKILQLHISTNEVLNEFDTIREAMEYIGITSINSHIGDVCRGKRNVAHGYKWKYAD